MHCFLAPMLLLPWRVAIWPIIFVIVDQAQRRITAVESLDFSCPCNLNANICDLNCCCDKVLFVVLFVFNLFVVGLSGFLAA